MDERPIGMFDSGVGGLTVFSEVIKDNPYEDIIYLGDTKRFPYGTKSKETIIDLSKKSIEFLLRKNVKAIIIACGTATSQALKTVEKIYKIPIIGIISPTVDSLAKEKNINKIGIIATVGTIKSGAWEKEIKEKIKNVEVINKGCSLLAPMAEEGWTDNEIAKLTIKEYLKDMKDIDKLILGCTHYPLFMDIIKKEYNENIEIIDTGKKIGNYLKEFLQKNKLQNSKIHKPNYEFCLTDTENKFIEVAYKLIKDKSIINNNTLKKVQI